MKRSGFKQKPRKPLKRSYFKKKVGSGRVYQLSQKKRVVKRVRSQNRSVWTSKEADTRFSIYIRKRDGKCLRCGKTASLTCSHFWGRTHSGTRYDEKNCIALCVGCHLFRWEKEKQGEYRDFMLKWLGEEEYRNLELRARAIMPRRDAIIHLMTWLPAKELQQ